MRTRAPRASPMDMLMAVEAPLSPEVAEPRTALASLLMVAGDYVSLLKPKIILLLVVTELGAMIVAARGWPRPEVLIGALLGLAMAASSAGAAARWLDRHCARLMPRTRRRAIAAARITPAAGRAFGMAAGLSGVALIAVTAP